LPNVNSPNGITPNMLSNILECELYWLSMSTFRLV
jgi:hypothetical protein